MSEARVENALKELKRKASEVKQGESEDAPENKSKSLRSRVLDALNRLFLLYCRENNPALQGNYKATWFEAYRYVTNDWDSGIRELTLDDIPMCEDGDMSQVVDMGTWEVSWEAVLKELKCKVLVAKRRKSDGLQSIHAMSDKSKGGRKRFFNPLQTKLGSSIYAPYGDPDDEDIPEEEGVSEDAPAEEPPVEEPLVKEHVTYKAKRHNPYAYIATAYRDEKLIPLRQQVLDALNGIVALRDDASQNDYRVACLEAWEAVYGAVTNDYDSSMRELVLEDIPVVAENEHKVSLVFENWYTTVGLQAKNSRADRKSDGSYLWDGVFRRGTCFEAVMVLSKSDWQELQASIKDGFEPHLSINLD